MSENIRQPIPKGVRFDIFKRDAFKCQYCGRTAPDVVLEIDHINPIANGGNDDPFNLITSCFDCNRGKGKKLLTENDTLQRQRILLEELNTKKEQLEMLIQWKTELGSLVGQQCAFVAEEIKERTGKVPSPEDEALLKGHISKFGLEEVLAALEIAVKHYYRHNLKNSYLTMIGKIGGICYNTLKQKEDPSFVYKQKVFYNAKRKYGGQYDEELVKLLLLPEVTENNYNSIDSILKNSEEFSDFVDNTLNLLGK